MSVLFSDGGLRIFRDQHGVPHVCAAHEADLYRGLGYCHGVDRALQMLLQRIVGQGRACELLEDSDEMLRLDRFFRRMNFAGADEQEVRKIPAGHQALAQAYCDGVNAAFRRSVPWEFRLIGYKPSPWRLEDCILMSRIIGYVALAQSQGDMERLLVEMVQADVPAAHLAELFPDLLGDLDTELLRKVVLGERFVPASVRWNGAIPSAVASNNWVVAGKKTASGLPLLANDPHLEVNRLPAVWYEVVLEHGQRFCITATMPGVPAALLGRSNDLAWSATYAFMDAIDSWIEDCRDGCYRRHSSSTDTWVAFRKRTEVIRRKKRPDVTVTFHENAHGVLDGDPWQPGLYLSTRWSSGAETGAESLSAFLNMPHASSVSTAMDLLGRVETAWNWVLADCHGNIGYQMSGRMPLRRKGQGCVPLPGWNPDNDWQGYVDPHDLPRAYNPAQGFLVTANDDLNHLGRARPINLPMGAYRAERIAKLLAKRDDWSVESTRQMQLDVYSTQAERFLGILRPMLPDNDSGNTLRQWDCRYDLDSRGATLLETFCRELVVEVFGAVCGKQVVRFLFEETGILTDFYANFDRVLLRADSVWYGAKGRDAVWRRVAARSLNGSARPWGERQELAMRHLLLGGRLPRWLGFDHGPVRLMGSRATIHQGQIYRSGGRDTSFAPSYRFVTDLAEPTAYTRLAGGPSDRRFSRWYTSEVASWLAGELKALRPEGRQPNADSPD